MKTKPAYAYDKKTNEFLGETIAYLDVEESEIQETDIFTLPANATFIAPPELNQNQAAVFNGEAWEITSDFRGKMVYKKSTGEAITYDKLGALPDDLTAKEYPDPYASWSDDFNNWWISLEDGMRKQRAEAAIEKNRLMALAEQKITDLSEATDTSIFDESEIDPEDIDLLKKWKRYRVFIKKVDTTALIIDWPELPEKEK